VFSKKSLISLLLISQQVILPCVVQATPLSENQLINFETMQIATGSVISSLQAIGDIPSSTLPLNWSGSFSDTGFTDNVNGSIAGKPFNLDFTGNSSGTIGNDIFVSVTSIGAYGAQAITSTSTAQWFYDSATGNYTSFSYDEQGTDNPWIAAIVIGVAVAVGIEVVKYVYNEIVKQPPPPPSTQPPIIIKINTGNTVTVNGTTTGCNFGIQDPVGGSCTYNPITHDFIGTISVPEPSTIMLMLFGPLAFGLPLFSRRKNKNRTYARS
jgi:hypothetical protein